MQRFELKFGSLSIVSTEPGLQCVTQNSSLFQKNAISGLYQCQKTPKDGNAINWCWRQKFEKIQNAKLFVSRGMIFRKVNRADDSRKCDFYVFSDSRRSYHRCKKGGVWQKPENVLLNCTPNGKKISYINLRFYCQNIQQFKYSAI